MKTVFQILILIFTTASCQTQEVDVKYENIEINIPGKPGPWIKYNENYYCYFKTDNDKFSSGSNHQFYILDKNGKIKKRNGKLISSEPWVIKSDGKYEVRGRITGKSYDDNVDGIFMDKSDYAKVEQKKEFGITLVNGLFGIPYEPTLKE